MLYFYFHPHKLAINVTTAETPKMNGAELHFNIIIIV